VAEVGAESVTVQEQDVIRVNGSDSLFDSYVEIDQSSVFLVRRFIQRVESGNPSVVLVVSRKVFPDLHSSVLEILVYPDYKRDINKSSNRLRWRLTLGLVVSGIGVPIDVLTLNRGQTGARSRNAKGLTPGAACKSMTV
jgi:hypothetical protein